MTKLRSLALFIVCLLAGTQLSNAQAPTLKMCALPTDSAATTKVTLAQTIAWADDLPLKVVCSDGKIYTLTQFTFVMITLKPFESREYGLANNGIPILARKAIDKMKVGDSIFLKDATGKGPDGTEVKLPRIVFAIKE